ncbi:MAG TPA: M50 family metallopeptidase [Candidatus Saccharimonadales bacterium]|nr:M50 family metallopeptidase [Candidatus Saccharimonadales bacterium]
MWVVLLILGLLMFIGLVVVHEFGHFLAARRGGVEVEEFGIGFPPRAWGKKTKSGFIFSLNWLPLGGFVKLKGEHDSDTEKGSYGAAKTSVKVKIMLAGVGMNLLAAFILFTVLAWAGMPQLINNQFTVKSDAHISRNEVLVASIEKNTPAAKAGLKERDHLVSVTGTNGVTKNITSADILPSVTKSFAGQNVTVTITRNGQTMNTHTTLLTTQAVNEAQKQGRPVGYLGIAPGEYSLVRSTWSAPIVALGVIKQFTAMTFQGLGTALNALIHGQGHKASEQVSGPVGIVMILKDSSLLGIQFVVMIIAIISLTLAIMNVLPIPALDGGRLFVTIVARLRGKPISQEIEERIYGYGFAALMILVILVTFVDVKRFF